VLSKINIHFDLIINSKKKQHLLILFFYVEELTPRASILNLPTNANGDLANYNHIFNDLKNKSI
jgi:hypothetical protein